MKGRQNRQPSPQLLRRLARNLRRIRKQRGVTSQERLAWIAEVDRITVSEIERATTGNPTIATLEALADGLECDIADFFQKKGKVMPRKESK